VVTLSVFAMFLLVAGSASAASETTKTTYEGFNPCNGDQIAVDGQTHTVNNSKPKHIHFYQQRHGNGVSFMPVPGHKYTHGDHIKLNMKVPAGPTVIRTWAKAVSQTQGVPDFMEQTTTTFNADGSMGPSKFESRCK
jgi:hypothetical protein